MSKYPEQAMRFEFRNLSLTTGLVAAGTPPFSIRRRVGSTSWDLAFRFEGSVFNCCGARQMVGFYTEIAASTASEDEVFKAECDWLTLFFRSTSRGLTHYGICTNMQERAVGKNTIINLLRKVGAKMVDDTPNQMHGPAKMQLFVWCPLQNWTAITKYIKLGDQDGGLSTWNPAYVTNEIMAEALKKYPPLTTLQQQAERDRAASEARNEAERRLFQQFQHQVMYRKDWLTKLNLVRGADYQNMARMASEAERERDAYKRRLAKLEEAGTKVSTPAIARDSAGRFVGKCSYLVDDLFAVNKYLNTKAK